jgi:hypothetical protein
MTPLATSSPKPVSKSTLTSKQLDANKGATTQMNNDLAESRLPLPPQLESSLGTRLIKAMSAPNQESLDKDMEVDRDVIVNAIANGNGIAKAATTESLQARGMTEVLKRLAEKEEMVPIRAKAVSCVMSSSVGVVLLWGFIWREIARVGR